MFEQAQVNEGYNKALRLLSRRDHSEFELRQKLAEYDGVDTIIQKLEQHGYVDDQRFAEVYVRYRSGLGQGPLKVRQELQRKGVSSSLVEVALEQPDVDWFVVARRVFHAKFDVVATEYRSKAKQQRFMQARGFTYEHISDAMRPPED